MKKLFTILTFFGIYNLAIGQATNYPDVPSTRIDQFTIEGDNFMGLGTCDQAIFSDDGGVSFTYMDIDVSFDKRMALVPNSGGERAYVLDKDQLFIMGIDMSITPIDVDAIDNFGDFQEIETNEENVFVVSDGAIWKSPHGTYNWSKLADVVYNEDYSIKNSSLTENYIWVSGSKGQIFKSHINDGGYIQLAGSTGSVSDLEMVNDNLGYFYSSAESGPMKTIDGGQSWSEMTSWPENNRLITTYGENVIVLANTNRYFYSTDGGETVHSVSNDGDLTGLVYQVNFSPDGKLYMSGTSSTFIKSEDFGATFESPSEYIRGDLYSLNMSEEGNGVACASKSILTTNDNGSTWDVVDLSSLSDNTEVYISSASPLGSNKYAVASNKGISIVEDGEVTSTFGPSAEQLHFNTEKGYMLAVLNIGSNSVISKSTDNGVTWENKLFSDAYFRGFRTTESGSIYLTSSDGPYYFISHDDGENWDEVDVEGTDRVTDLHIVGDEIIYAASRKVYLSQDAGITFDQVADVYIAYNVRIIAPGHYTYTSAQNSQINIFERKPDENVFRSAFQACGTAVSNAQIGSTLWYGRKGGHILKYEFNFSSTASEDIEVTQFSLSPNIVEIGQRIQLPNELTTGLARLTAVDGSTQILPLSTNSLSTDKLNKGLYFLSLETNDKLYNTKFMVY